MSACSQTPLGVYLAAHGAAFEPSLVFKTDTFGASIFTTTPLPSGTSIVSCPFASAISPSLVRHSLADILLNREWTDHELLALYLVLHKLPPSTDLQLDHHAYVDSLPKAEDLATPSYWTSDELELLEGTNLAPAVRERMEGWRIEWQLVRDKLPGALGNALSWELFLWASTIISSRAFPSTLLHDGIDTTPILLPGVDTLNHSPHGVKISWLSDVIKRTVTIVIDEPVPADSQVFNTYGSKSNEELLLGYGFTVPSNRSDTVALKLSLPPYPPSLPLLLASFSPPLSTLRHLVPRSGVIPEELLGQMRLFLATEEEREGLEGGRGRWEDVLGRGVVGWENEMDVLSALGEMLERKLVGLGGEREAGAGVREGVRRMVEEYRNGQVEVLQAAVKDQRRRVEETIAQAASEGVDLGFEEDIEEDEVEE